VHYLLHVRKYHRSLGTQFFFFFYFFFLKTKPHKSYYFFNSLHPTNYQNHFLKSVTISSGNQDIRGLARAATTGQLVHLTTNELLLPIDLSVSPFDHLLHQLNQSKNTPPIIHCSFLDLYTRYGAC
jgi:hypothetical protein